MSLPSLKRDLSKCKFEEEKVDYVTADDFAIKDLEFFPFGALVLFWVVALVFALWIGASGWWSIILATLVIALAEFTIRCSMREPHAKSMNKSREYFSSSRATKCTEEAISKYEKMFNCRDTAFSQYDPILCCAKKARKEFNENAFAPYWDAVEKSMIMLDEYQSTVDRLERAVSDYKYSVNHGENNFPEPPLSKDLLPNLNSIIIELHEIVRLGQTNFEFASIWEERLTRNVLVKRFGSLDESVLGLEKNIIRSISRLEDTLKNT